jgi:leader peptidase (prepilin peptidase)/N-methyltransferase
VVWLVVLLGLLVGTVLNHLADRLTTRQSIATAPRCTYCEVPRPPISWVATVGYLVMRFRCPACGAPLPIRHVLAELVTALALAALYQSRGPSVSFLFGTFHACVFLLVLITDLEHRLILNVVILPAIVVALVGSLLPGAPTPLSALVGGALGFGFFFVIALMRPGGMGAGDIKLAAFIGAVVGFPNVITALVIGIFAGGFVSLFLVITRIRGLKSYIPYGPFLVFGGVLVAYFGPLLTRWLGAP